MNDHGSDARTSPGDATPRIERRAVLAALPLAAAGALGWSSELGAAEDTQAAGAQDPPAVPAFALDSPPVLQNPSSAGMSIAWAVTGRATGWVEYGPSPEELRHRAISARRGLVAMDSRFLSARIEGLSPGEKVYYRVVSAPIEFRSAYDIHRGDPVASGVGEFTTPNARAESASFIVINDTHENVETLTRLTRAIAEKPGDFTIWNGDVFNDIFSDEQIIAHVLRPVGAAYAASRPVLFTSGNHDVRGPEARGLERAIIPWQREEPLGRSFAVRYGPLAIVGLDTGEDKPDVRPVFAGLADFEKYRRDQRDWLAEALRRPEIAAAPFLVICCHIPLNGLPGQNGGDTPEDFARWSKFSRDLWGPLIEAAGAQLVISGHTHRFRYDVPTPERPWGQLVGGAPDPAYATIIRGHATATRLTITASRLDGSALGEWSYAPRAV
jgi:predicted phosphodiesterase